MENKVLIKNEVDGMADEYNIECEPDIKPLLKLEQEDKPLDTAGIQLHHVFSSYIITQNVLENDGVFTCVICGYSTEAGSNLHYTHWLQHTGENPFKCAICDYSSTNTVDVMRHIEQHTREKLYKCRMCEYTTPKDSNFICHTLLFHASKKPFKCPICEFETTDIGYINRHVRSHSNQTFYQCAHCLFSAINKESLIQHMQNHIGINALTCYLCSFKCSTKETMKIHVKQHKLYKCNMCDFVTHRKNHFAKHKSIHGVKCLVCGYEAINKEVLRMHLIIRHVIMSAKGSFTTTVPSLK